MKEPTVDKPGVGPVPFSACPVFILEMVVQDGFIHTPEDGDLPDAYCVSRSIAARLLQERA